MRPEGLLETEKFLAALSEQGFWQVDTVLKPSQIEEVFHLAGGIYQRGGFKPGQVGRGQSLAQKSEVRSDEIHWIESWDLHPALQSYQQHLEVILNLARQELFLPIRRFESHFARYSVGSFYRPHSDQHLNSPHRLLSIVLYLNDLPEGGGGKLRIESRSGQFAAITPVAGREIIFDSRLLHEVEVAQSPRWTLATWMRSD